MVLFLPEWEFRCWCGVYGECPGVIQAPPGLGDTDVDVGATSTNMYIVIHVQPMLKLDTIVV